MSKEQEIMDFLHEKVFDPILNSKDVPKNIKNGTNLTIGRMTHDKTAAEMIDYFWKSLIKDNSIRFSKLKKSADLPRFEDVFEEFRDKFNDEWLRS